MAKRVARAVSPRTRKAAPAPSSPQLPARRPAKPAAQARDPGPAAQTAGMQLYTPEGARKYLTAAERDTFLAVAGRTDRDIHTLCMTLAYSG